MRGGGPTTAVGVATGQLVWAVAAAPGIAALLAASHPAFVALRLVGAALATHGLLFAAMTLAWLLLVSRGAALLLVPRVRRVVDVVTGAVLIAFGFHLATERR